MKTNGKKKYPRIGSCRMLKDLKCPFTSKQMFVYWYLLAEKIRLSSWMLLIIHGWELISCYVRLYMNESDAVFPQKDFCLVNHSKNYFDMEVYKVHKIHFCICWVTVEKQLWFMHVIQRWYVTRVIHIPFVSCVTNESVTYSKILSNYFRPMISWNVCIITG